MFLGGMSKHLCSLTAVLGLLISLAAGMAMAAPATPVKVGLVMPASGPLAPFGLSAQMEAQLALQDAKDDLARWA